jgi:hypothetical protein
LIRISATSAAGVYTLTAAHKGKGAGDIDVRAGAGDKVPLMGIFTKVAGCGKVDNKRMVEVISQPSFTFRACDMPLYATVQQWRGHPGI